MIFNLKCRQILIILISVLIIPSIKAETKDQHIKVSLRTIGHEFLLQINDSTSRVLPIKKINGRYAVLFEREFSFEPDLLFLTVSKVIEETLLLDSYIVEIENCNTNEVVHSFEASFEKLDVSPPCKLRALPKDCYIFYFTVIESEKATYLSENNTTSSLNFTYIIAVIILIIGTSIALYLNRRKKRSRLNIDLINIGQYQFNQKKMTLLFKEHPVELSSKESDLLFLLFSNENKTLEREYILNIVWGDGGNYVGRTLDVFISKLRKKLEADPSLKIINVRGIGYRFVIN